MKQLLTKEEVAKAIKDLEAQGKKVTCTSLHAALGNRGSMSTLGLPQKPFDVADCAFWAGDRE